MFTLNLISRIKGEKKNKSNTQDNESTSSYMTSTKHKILEYRYRNNLASSKRRLTFNKITTLHAIRVRKKIQTRVMLLSPPGGLCSPP